MAAARTSSPPIGLMEALAGVTRAKWLPLAASCVSLGAASAWWGTGRPPLLHFLLALVGGVAAHAAVNSLNEYSDFLTGVDARTKRTPFSGGSGTLQRLPRLRWLALSAGLGSAALAAVIGLYFISVRGPGILLAGIPGLLVVLAYTPWLTRNPLLCLVAPGLGFGTCMVMGTEFALSERYSWAGFVSSLVPFFLVSDLLLLNQFPDAAADRRAGRRNLVIAFGGRAGAAVYAAFAATACASLAAGAASRVLPAWTLLGLATLPLLLKAAVDAFRFYRTPRKLVPAMGLNVIANITTPLLIAAGFLLSR